jgi:putative acetyltransferase
MMVRRETERDHDAIRRVNLAPFTDHPFSHQTEHLIVDAPRTAGALTLSLVADVGGEVVGLCGSAPYRRTGTFSGRSPCTPSISAAGSGAR